MEAIDKASSTAKAWLKDIGDQSRWSKHVFHPTVCCVENKKILLRASMLHLGLKDVSHC